jgi:hypothetical protein
MKKFLPALALVFFTLPACAQSILFTNSSAVGVGTSAPTAGAALDLSYNTNSVLLPAGTSGQRPTGVAGMMRYNSAIPGVEAFYSGSWNTLGTGTITSIATNNGITGGTIIGSGTIGLAPIGTAQLLANPTSGSGIPVGTSLSAEIDAALGSTQGSILYRDATDWVILAPGTAGTFLQTEGASADPQWSAVDLGSQVTGNLPVGNLNSGTGASSSTFWRGDGTWGVPASSGITSCTTVSATPGANPVEVSCPSGYIMTGGGCNNGPIAIQQSYPINSNTWHCQGTAAGTAWAICCN